MAWCDGLICSVTFALLFQVPKWVSGCVVLEAVRVVHVNICKFVAQRGVAARVHPLPQKPGLLRATDADIITYLFFGVISLSSPNGVNNDELLTASLHCGVQTHTTTPKKNALSAE